MPNSSSNSPGLPPTAGEIAEQLRQLEHDLRTPLGTLAAALELLKAAPAPDGAAAAVQVMERQIRQLTTQLERLHDISRALSPGAPASPSGNPPL